MLNVKVTVVIYLINPTIILNSDVASALSDGSVWIQAGFVDVEKQNVFLNVKIRTKENLKCIMENLLFGDKKSASHVYSR